MTTEALKRGDFVELSAEATASVKKRGMVTLASSNGDSLMVMFDGSDHLFLGYASMIPLLREDGEYRELVEGRVVTLTRIEPKGSRAP